MKTLDEKLFELISRTITIKDFETWLYSDPEITRRLESDNFIFEIVCLNYNEKEALYNLKQLMLDHYGEAAFLIHLIEKSCHRLMKVGSYNEMYSIIQDISSYYDFSSEYHLLDQFYYLTDEIDLIQYGYIKESDTIHRIKTLAQTVTVTFNDRAIEEKRSLLKSGMINDVEYVANKRRWYEFWK